MSAEPAADRADKRASMIARQIAQTDPSLVPGSQEFLARVGQIMAAASPDLLARADALLSAP